MSEFTPGETMEGSGGFRSLDDWGELGEPQKLGNWILGEPLGAGGWGVVYGARHELWEEEAAVKVLRPALAAVKGNPEAFLREANALRALRGCESIVEVRDVGNLDGYHYMVMELAEGLEVAGERMLSLAHWMQWREQSDQSEEEGFSLEEVLRVGADVLEALGMAHGQGVIHRDIKPANILLTAQGRAKLADFGLVKLIDAELAEVRNGTKALDQRSQTGAAIKGTLSYMSPEQEEGRPLDGRSDLYSLAVVLYQMMTGMLPKGRFKLPGEMGMGFADGLDGLLDKCLQPYPKLRCQSAEEAREELEGLGHRARAAQEAQRKEKEEQAARELEESNQQKKAREEARRKEAQQREKEAELLRKAEEQKHAEQARQKAKEQRRREKEELRKEQIPANEQTKKGLIVSAVIGGMILVCAMFFIFGGKGEEEASALDGRLAVEEREFEIAPGVMMTMCWIPATTSEEWKRLKGKDTFTMGSENGADDEKPVREVRLTKGFWMGKYEVTQGQWEAVMGTSMGILRNVKENQGSPRDDEGKDYPVYNMTWGKCVEYGEKLKGIGEKGWEWSLPSEAQWEYACRAGSERKWSHGDEESKLGDYAWYSGMYGGNSKALTHEVGGKKGNRWGLHDMHGNVFELTRDWYGAYEGGQATDPAGPSVGSYRVRRGGSVLGTSSNCRSTSRGRHGPGPRRSDSGFRVVLQSQ